MIADYITQKITKKLILITTFFAVLLMPAASYAAGTLTVTGELGKSSVTSSEENTIKLYGTASGANTAGFLVRLTISGTTISDYVQTGSPFTVNDVVEGTMPGATTVLISVGYSSAQGGGGKQLMGEIKLAATSPKTVSYVLNEVDAYDADLQIMTGVGSSGSYTVNAPAPPPSQPAPQQPSQPPSNTPSPSQQPSQPPSNTPSPSQPSQSNQPPTTVNKTVVPKEDGTTETLTQEEVDKVLTEQSAEMLEEVVSTIQKKEASKNNRLLLFIIGLPTLAIAATMFILKRKKFAIHHTVAAPQQFAAHPIDSHPPVMNGGIQGQQGPQVIHPTESPHDQSS